MPISLLKLLGGKDVLVGVIDVATDKVETAEEIAGVIAEALKYVPKERLRLHQLRHGADGARDRGGEARGAGCRSRAGARTIGLKEGDTAPLHLPCVLRLSSGAPARSFIP